MLSRRKYRIFALFFAFYLPVSLVGLPLHKHYCKGELEDIQLLFEAESCHEKALEERDHGCCSTEASCHSNDSESEEKDDCCDDELEILQADLTPVLFKTLSLKKVPFIKLLPVFTNKDELYERDTLIQISKFFHIGSPFPDGSFMIIFLGRFLC